MEALRKEWWAPVHRGLVIDGEGKHIRQLDGAIWLLLYCFLCADRRTGEFSRKYATISTDTGTPARTIRAWMRRLREREYIATTGNGRSVHVRVLRWRSTGPRQTLAGPNDNLLPVRAARNGLDQRARGEISEGPCGQFGGGRRANKSLLTRSYLQQQNGLQPLGSRTRTSDENAFGTSREELLAVDLAEGLRDAKGLNQYRAYARRYPETLLRELLSEARAVPAEKIKRSRAALFRYLLNHHVNEDTTHSRD